ncbi:MAG: hypothetical protein Q7J98_06610, partial [Kiritimatiellia bacterium]|nr:hypothetical protein [Kiritimatiellia bacterium]
MKKKILFGVSVLAIMTAITVQAEVPPLINYQGRLTDLNGAPVPDGQTNITFSIYDNGDIATAPAGLIWQETQTNVSVYNGLFSVLLGSANPLYSSHFPTNAGFTNWLEVKVNDETLSPRKELVSVAYAFRASDADMVDGKHWWDIVVAATNQMVEKDPTVVNWVKDGVKWDELKGVQGMPGCFADGVDNEGITAETDPTVPGWVKDGASWEEIQNMPPGFA